MKEAGSHFCDRGYLLKNIELPQVQSVREYFCSFANGLESVKMQNLEKTGEYFLDDAVLYDPDVQIKEFDVPKISRVQWFFSPNRHIVSFINRAKKYQRINRRDITALDEKSELLPQEVQDASKIIED